MEVLTRLLSTADLAVLLQQTYSKQY